MGASMSGITCDVERDIALGVSWRSGPVFFCKIKFEANRERSEEYLQRVTVMTSETVTARGETVEARRLLENATNEMKTNKTVEVEYSRIWLVAAKCWNAEAGREDRREDQRELLTVKF